MGRASKRRRVNTLGTGQDALCTTRSTITFDLTTSTLRARKRRSTTTALMKLLLHSVEAGTLTNSLKESHEASEKPGPHH